MSYLLQVYDLDLTIIVLNVAQSVGSGVKSNVRRTVVPNTGIRSHMYDYLRNVLRKLPFMIIDQPLNISLYFFTFTQARRHTRTHTLTIYIYKHMHTY